MEQSYNLDGTRNREYRPYIAFEETTYNTSLYSPYHSVNYGLYSQPVPPRALSNPEDIFFYETLKNIPCNTGMHGAGCLSSPVGIDKPCNLQKYAMVNTGGNKMQIYKRLFAT
jgi:hypothetical protein